MAKNPPRPGARPDRTGSTRSTGSGPAGGASSGSSRGNRAARLAELQKTQKSRERRTTLIIGAACTALVVLLGGVITYAVIDGRNNQPAQAILALGVSASAASCDPVTTDTAVGNSDHVGPGTSTPGTTHVDYTTVPPSSGPHFVQPDISGRGYYTPGDSPAVETLVHNLEHGYTILWYAPSEVGQAELLQQVAQLGAKLTPSQGKFIVAPLDESRGTLPAGKKFALSHWSATTDPSTGTVTAQAGHRQLCGGLSGSVVSQFVTAYPKTDSPEPNAA